MAQNARFYDGKTADPHDLDIEISQAKLIGRSPSGNKLVEWDINTIRVLNEPEAKRQAIITTTTDNIARLYISQSVFQKLNYILHRKARPFFRVYNSLSSISFWFIVTSIVLFIIVQSVPKFSPYIAQKLPIAWEESLGEYAFKQLLGKKKVCRAKNGLESLEKIALILQATQNNITQMTINVIQEETVNAIAFPGGKIIIYSGLIKESESPSEIAGVIAHEMGHVLKKHPTESFVRNLGLTLLTKLMFENIDSIGNMGVAGQLLLELNYSRKAEQEADKIALQILEENNIDANGFKAFFERQQDANHTTTASQFDILTYLSTHPRTSERINMIEGPSDNKKYKQLLSKEEWIALKKICEN